jgi:hypothetical protein
MLPRMKALAIAALVCALGAAGAAGYGMVETKGNYDYMSAEMASSDPKSAKLAELDRLVYDDYAKALGREVAGAWVGALLAVILGAVAVKKGAKGMGIAAIVIGLGAAGVAFSIMPQPLVL